jgi:hypothetical protein
MKQKKCKECGDLFSPTRQLQPACNKYECMQSYAMKHLKTKKIEKDKVARKTLRAFNDTDKNIQKQLAQKVFNTYIRMRDGKICISCGFVGDGRQFHCGHYKPRGMFSQLAFSEENCNSQCSICNTHLSGNLVAYREALINKIGIDRVEYLESCTEPVKYDIDFYKDIITTYRKKIKELQTF